MNAPAAPRGRLAWIDLFRGAAVLVMIETHVVNTFLASAIRTEPWFTALNYLNGLVAPSFLFIAGFVQGLERRAAHGRRIDYRRRARRLLGLLALGYALQFPWAELAQHRWVEAVRIGTQVDVLQCLAAALALILGVTWLAQRLGDRRVWWAGVTALAAGAVLAAPASAHWLGLPVPLQAWVNGRTGSWFPLPSWAGFVFLGALMGAWPRRPWHERAGGIAGLIVLAWACRGAEYSPLSPAFFLERSVWVLVLAAGFAWWATRSVPKLPVFAGSHSLTLYVVHLLTISWLVGAGVPVTAFSLPVVFGLVAIVGAISLGITRLVVWWQAQPKRWLFLPTCHPALSLQPVSEA